MSIIKQRRSLGLPLTLATLVLFGWAVWGSRESIDEVFTYTPDARLLGLGVSSVLIGLFLTSCRWCLLVRTSGLRLAIRDAILLGFSANALNSVIPGGVAGDVFKAAHLHRMQPGAARVVASIVMDRIVGLLGLCLLAGVSGCLAWPRSGRDVRLLVGVAWAASLLGGLGLAFCLTSAPYRGLSVLFRGRERAEALLADLELTVATYRARPLPVLSCLLLAMASHALLVVAFYLVGRALFPVGPSLSAHFLIVPLILFSTFVPLPFGALGLGELVSARLFLLSSHSTGAVAMMAFRLVLFAADLVALIIYMADSRRLGPLSKPLVPRLSTAPEDGPGDPAADGAGPEDGLRRSPDDVGQGASGTRAEDRSCGRDR